MQNKVANINNEKKIVYIHIPKTAGTTIEQIFFNKNGIGSEHKDITFYKEYYDYFIFSFVRNPYTRIISIYNYFINGGNKSNHDKNKIKNGLDINDFLNEYNQNNLPFLKTQYSYLQDSEHINFIGKFEIFDIDLKNVCNRTNIEFTDIHNRVTEYNDYLIKPEFIDMISSIYDIDFIKYNYIKIKINDVISLKELNKIIKISEINILKGDGVNIDIVNEDIAAKTVILQ